MEPRVMRIETEREEDGRWIAEIPALPGVIAYAGSEQEARARAEVLAFRVIADRLDNGESIPPEAQRLFAA
jgi:predicted RNase H-like HicB family nuclease